MSAKLRALWAVRFIRFCTIGFVCTLVQEAILILGLCYDFNDVLVNGIGFVVSTAVSYVLNSRLTWNDRDKPASSAGRVAIFYFVALSAGTLSYVAGTCLGIPPVPASLISIAVGGLVTYFANDQVTFRDKRETRQETAMDDAHSTGPNTIGTATNSLPMQETPAQTMTTGSTPSSTPRAHLLAKW